MSHKNLYRYRAVITAVYDGDTVTADIDLGLHVWLRGEKLRLARIDAPELRGAERPQGLVSRDFLRGLVLGESVWLHTVRRGKYGRYLAELWLDDDRNVNDVMVASGQAQPYGK